MYLFVGVLIIEQMYGKNQSTPNLWQILTKL